jgi:hypothetical protein
MILKFDLRVCFGGLRFRLPDNYFNAVWLDFTYKPTILKATATYAVTMLSQSFTQISGGWQIVSTVRRYVEPIYLLPWPLDHGNFVQDVKTYYLILILIEFQVGPNQRSNGCGEVATRLPSPRCRPARPWPPPWCWSTSRGPTTRSCSPARQTTTTSQCQSTHQWLSSWTVSFIF